MVFKYVTTFRTLDEAYVRVIYVWNSVVLCSSWNLNLSIFEGWVVHCMFVTCSLYVRCMFVICLLYVPCMFVICSLYVRYMFIVCSLYVPCMFVYMFLVCSLCSLYVRCILLEKEIEEVKVGALYVVCFLNCLMCVLVEGYLSALCRMIKEDRSVVWGWQWQSLL